MPVAIGYSSINSNANIINLITYVSATKNAALDLSGLSDNITRTFTFPNASGTIALVGGSGVGTVTSVAALTLGTTGTDVSSTVANSTTTPVITLNIPDAGASARGLITTGVQTIAGNKTFSGQNTFGDINKYNVGILMSQSGGGSTSTGYTSFSAYGTNGVAIGTITQSNILTFNSTALRTYTFPDASGTLALTSSLSSYLPLSAGSGNKLTGDLYINKANSSLVFQGNTTDALIYNTGSNLVLADNATGTKGITINVSTGNVGIGTSSPARTLHLNSASDTRLLITDNTIGIASTDGTYYRQNGVNAYIVNQENGTFQLGTNDSYFLTALANGNVGIGETNPSGKLSITNDGAAAWSFYMKTPSTTTKRNSFGFFDNSSALIASIVTDAEADNTANLAFKTGTSNLTRLSITSGGNVLINNPTDTAPNLSIKGSANVFTIAAVASSTTSQSYGQIINAGTNSSDFCLYLANYSGATVFLKVRGDGWLVSPTTYNNTSGVAANVGIDSAGNIFRATSSIKYKKDIKPYDKGLDTILLMNPIYYKSISDFDGDKQFAGFIAEEIDALGLNEFVQYNDENNEPEGLNYGNITAILVKAIQEQQSIITSLQEQINELKNK